MPSKVLDNGVVRDATAEEEAEIQARSAIDPARAHAEMWARIEAERERRRDGGILLGQNWFHSDLPTRTQLAILDSKGLRASWPDSTVVHPEWKTMNVNPATGQKVKVPMTIAMVRQILDLGITKEGTIFSVAESHRTAMQAAANPYLYDFSTGWPDICPDQ